MTGCTNCKHGIVSPDAEPCASCDVYEKWAPEEEPAEDPEVPTLRDRFAMAALTGIVAGVKDGVRFSHLTDQAYQFADAMLKSRKEEK